MALDWRLFVPLALGAAAMLWVMPAYRRARQMEALDDALPSALFSAAAFDPRTPPERVLKNVAQGTSPPLRTSLEMLVRSLEAGVSFCSAVSTASRAYPSALFARVLGLLQAAYDSGADLSGAFRQVAEDAYQMRRLEQERRQNLMVPTYTLYCGALVVPALLGGLYRWTASAASPYANAVFLGLHVYLLAFGILSAAFLSVAGVRRWFMPLAVMLSSFVFFVFYAVQML